MGLDCVLSFVVLNLESPGRTGRVGNTGKATSFFDAEGDGDVAGKLVDMLTKTGVEVPDWLGEAGAGGCGGGGRDLAGGLTFIRIDALTDLVANFQLP